MTRPFSLIFVVLLSLSAWMHGGVGFVMPVHHETGEHGCHGSACAPMAESTCLEQCLSAAVSKTDPAVLVNAGLVIAMGAVIGLFVRTAPEALVASRTRSYHDPTRLLTVIKRE